MKEEKEQTVIDKTLLYLENYREMERYIKEAVSETSQVPDIGKYNISAERAFLQSVRECRAETVILFEHLKQALASLKEDAEAAGEGYKYVSKEWRSMRERIIEVYDNVDIYALYDKKVSGLFMKRVVFTLILAAFIFTVVMIFVFLRMGSEPSTLIENVFRFLSVEGGAMALIKSVKTVKGTKSNGEIQHNDEPEQDDEEVQG